MKQILNKIKWTPGATDAMKRCHQLLPKPRHNEKTDLCLVVDGMNLAYMAYYAYSKLSHKGKSTSILFGFPQMLRGILQTYRAKKVIVCWDGKKDPNRVALLPGYKLHRLKNRDPKQRKAFLGEIKLLRKLLHRMGIAQAHDPAIEGDDMIYMITRDMQKLYKVIIISGDKDFKQLINWDVSLYNPRKRIVEVPFAFSAGNCCELAQYIDYLCIVGDSSDDIKGIHGIGEGRARAFFQKWYYVKYYLEDDKAEYTGMIDKETVKKIYDRNRAMIDLKYFNEKYLKGVKPKWFRKSSQPSFNEERYDILCNKWNLKLMLTDQFKKTIKSLNDE